MNQHNRDDILYESPRGQPIVELRSIDDRLVLFTDDIDIAQRFEKWNQRIITIAYSFEPLRGATIIIGLDLYFPKSAKKQLIRALNNNRPTVPKKEGSLR